jgi:hypothetical protein
LSGLLAIPNLILGGDLNFILSADEHWGGPFLPGPAEATYKEIIASNNLIDIQPIRLVPTWRNGRAGPDAIARRLDRFLVAEGLLSSFVAPSSWVEYPYLSDHAPILLQLLPTVRRLTPFKFNHRLLTSDNYSAIVHSTWTDPRFLTEPNPQSRLVWKLKELKSKTIQWEKEKIKEEKACLLLLETQISTLYIATSSALTVEESDRLNLLEAHRASILRDEEFRWRLRSRATWLQCGDSNSSYFHKVASYNRNKKTIWSIDSANGGVIRGQKDLLTEAATYFTLQYKASNTQNLPEKASTASLFPRMITAEEATELSKPVTLAELKDILHHFKKERSPGPDGWTTEFFIYFFELVGEDLLQMVEDSRLKGKIAGGLNSTFLVMIPKENNPHSFNDYRPIALCNLVYKVIAKVISNRIKPYLGKSLSERQLGFLKGRRIQDAIGAAHECIHSIKQKNQKALILKLDLKKAFDCIDWEFLRLILHAVGFGDLLTNWILACVTNANFVVLINGEASSFFKSERGLRQGCPLSPYLFILIMEGLSLLLNKSFIDHHISGIKVSKLIKIFLLMFVDDVLIMTKADLVEWTVIQDTLLHFCSISGLSINHSKSSAHYWGLSASELLRFKDHFTFTFIDLKEGFRYLGYQLKMGATLPGDWRWLVAIFEKKIDFWCNKWLSMGGRFILIKAVLESLAVFWMTLERIPNKITSLLRRLAFNFLWNGRAGKRRIHLCSWETLSKPRRAGGWGLKNLHTFNTALLASSFWRAVTQGSIWHRIIVDKYLGSLPLCNWIRRTTFQTKRASPIWKGLVASTPVILHWLRWKPGTGKEIKIGKDMIIGLEESSLLSPSLCAHLSTLNILTLSDVRLNGVTSTSGSLVGKPRPGSCWLVGG